MSNTYTSKYSPGVQILEHQLIAELLCENRAKAKKVELTIGFWQNEVWAGIFKSHLRRISWLLKIYDPDVIIKVIKDSNIYSLNPKWVVDKLDVEAKRQSQQIKCAVIHDRITDSKGKQNQDKDLSHLDG